MTMMSRMGKIHCCRQNKIFSTTTVTNGTTMAVVIAPGMTARIGRIAAQLTDGGKDKNSLGVKQQSVLL
jgi:magnesium-transporting ATPase (P-type)